MHTTCGICVDSYVKIDNDCAITCEVDDERAIFRFGGVRSTGVSLALSQASLRTLIDIGTDALRTIQAGDETVA